MLQCSGHVLKSTNQGEGTVYILEDIRARVTVCYLVFTVTFLAQETFVPQYVSVKCGLERRDMGTMCKSITRIEMCKEFFPIFFYHYNFFFFQ